MNAGETIGQNDNRLVLVVDDDLDICDTAKEILEFENFEVTVVNNGYDAIDKVRSQEFRCILLDIKMPGINGMETLAEIRKIKPSQKVILMTGYSVSQVKEEAGTLGVKDIFSKPVDFDEVFPRL